MNKSDNCIICDGLKSVDIELRPNEYERTILIGLQIYEANNRFNSDHPGIVLQCYCQVCGIMYHPSSSYVRIQ